MAATDGGGPLNENIVLAGLFSPVGLLFFSFRYFGPWVLSTACGINFRCVTASAYDCVLSESENVRSKRQLYKYKVRENFPLRRFPLLRFTATPAPYLC